MCVYKVAGWVGWWMGAARPARVLREVLVVRLERTAATRGVTSYLKKPRTYDAHVTEFQTTPSQLR